MQEYNCMPVWHIDVGDDDDGVDDADDDDLDDFVGHLSVTSVQTMKARHVYLEGAILFPSLQCDVFRLTALRTQSGDKVQGKRYEARW